jgi:hypothetical protein
MTKHIDTSALGYRFIDASSRSVDWSKARGEDMEGVTVHLPAVTLAQLEAHDHAPDEFDAADWLEDNLSSYLSPDDQFIIGRTTMDAGIEDAEEWFVANWRTILSPEKIEEIEADLAEAKAEHDEEALEEAIDGFKGSDAWYEWKDSYEPAMNFIWPCEPSYRRSLEDAATMIEELAGATALVTITPPEDSVEDETTGIVLTGGGMDLSWDICAAYICCGQIPPIRLLEDLPLFAGAKRGPMQAAIMECIELAASWMEGKASRMREHRTRIEHNFNK